MPVRKRGVHRFKHELDLREWLDLTIGAGRRSAFVDDSERRAAWEIHRDKLLEQDHAGHRPQAWWDFERPGEGHPMGGQQTLRLLELGEIGDDELRVLKREWRREEQVARAKSERPQAPGSGQLKEEIYMRERRFYGIPDWWRPDDPLERDPLKDRRNGDMPDRQKDGD